MVLYFLPEGAATRVLSGLVAVPLLALSTIVVEILFLSFLVATGLLIRQSFRIR